jgi:chemotaxis protein methyltransferase CheR
MTFSERSDGGKFGPAEFQRFRDLLQEICGIDLADNKQYLVANRVRRIMAEHRFSSLSELIQRIEQVGNRALRQEVIDAMTTNETFWFRDSYPFDYLSNVLLPELQRQKKGAPARIWSAACSSGQEPYSLSIAVEEYFRTGPGAFRFPVEIMATDLSSSVLNQARKGEYDRLSMARGLSRERLERFFDPVGDERWRVKSTVQSRVQFRPLNLQESYFLLGRFDVVFCRNVLIYFSAHLKREILRKIRSAMVPGGYLFLGSSESLGGASDLFEMIHCNPGVVYRAR